MTEITFKGYALKVNGRLQLDRLFNDLDLAIEETRRYVGASPCYGGMLIQLTHTIIVVPVTAIIQETEDDREEAQPPEQRRAQGRRPTK